MIETFKTDVNEGLSKPNKSLPSKYFYDAIGDKIFVDIMNMPEYYLTNAEASIFKNQTTKIIDYLKLSAENYFEIIELGAGDGSKTKLLLKALLEKKFDFKYLPIDISKDALNGLKHTLSNELKALKVEPKQGDYFKVLDNFNNSATKKIILFLGSNIGNMSDVDAQLFLEKLNNSIQKNDMILLGVDLIKNKTLVLPAYSDKSGITKKFNLNLLTRINIELEANFNISNFSHLATYTEDEGIARSFLVSDKEQSVSIKSLDKTFHFKKDEKIHTENSRKYNDELLEQLLKNTSLKVIGKLLDEKNYFADYILIKE